MRAKPTREALEAFFARSGELAGGFTGAPVPTLIECDPEAERIVLSYDIPDWMLNPWKVMHGGLTTTLMDSAFGLLASWCNGGVMCPTVSMTTNYLRPVHAGAPLIVEARVERFGRVNAHLSASCWQNEKLTTTATGVFSTASPRGTLLEQG
ncbi:MAG: PaaI family thioesterase [Oscillospiraceae bacterium]|nr:PaaI family thioesterase [Oscillospiraceae bacterium]